MRWEMGLVVMRKCRTVKVKEVMELLKRTRVVQRKKVVRIRVEITAEKGQSGSEGKAP